MQVTTRTASKGKQKVVYDRSSVEVEQLLPQIEPVHDPRHLYASDSPVIEDPDSDEELYKSAEEVVENIDLNGQDDGTTKGRNLEPDVCFFSFDLRLSLLTGMNRLYPFGFPAAIFTAHCPRLTSFRVSVFTGVMFVAPGSLGTSLQS